MPGFLDGLLDLLFPPRCAVCAASSAVPLCSSCLQSLPYCEDPLCRRCGAPVRAAADDCPECRGKDWAFGRACALGLYRDGLKDCVQAIKYRYREGLVGVLASAAIERHGRTFHGATAVTFVPLSPKRESERGFNQARTVAGELSRLLGLECRDVLTRTRETADQNSLTADKRPANVRDAFAPRARTDPSIEGARMLLVDDVLTTGSTASECARALLAAGAAQVDVFTLARTLHGSPGGARDL